MQGLMQQDPTHPPTPGLTPAPVLTLPQRAGGAVPTKPQDPNALQALVDLYHSGLYKLGSMMPSSGGAAPMPGQNPAQGILDSVATIAQPVKSFIDWAGNR